MKRQILTFITFCMACTLSAQTITGIVIDEQSQPIPFVSVVLYSLPDSTLITGSVTNEKGEFSFNSDKYNEKACLKVSFVGYQTQILPIKSQQTITLKSTAIQLGESVIKGNMPKFRLKNDALVATVQNSVLSKAGTGIDVLKRLPSITGDKGNFSVFGKGQAKIYINNRMVRNVSELDNLNSGDIKDVEIITNPGAKYDASVKVVIRINTIKKTGDGFSFDMRSSYFQSQNTNLTEQLNVNCRNKGLDIFGTFSYSHNKWLRNCKMWQETYVDTLWIQNNGIYSTGYSDTWMGTAGANCEISPNRYIA